MITPSLEILLIDNLRTRRRTDGDDIRKALNIIESELEEGSLIEIINGTILKVVFKGEDKT